MVIDHDWKLSVTHGVLTKNVGNSSLQETKSSNHIKVTVQPKKHSCNQRTAYCKSSQYVCTSSFSKTHHLFDSANKEKEYDQYIIWTDEKADAIISTKVGKLSKLRTNAHTEPNAPDFPPDFTQETESRLHVQMLSLYIGFH